MNKKVVRLFNDSMESAHDKIIKICTDNSHHRNDWRLIPRTSKNYLCVEILYEKREYPVPPPFSQNIRIFYISFIQKESYTDMIYEFRFTYPFMALLILTTAVFTLAIILTSIFLFKGLLSAANEGVQICFAYFLASVIGETWLMIYLLILKHRDKKRIEIFEELVLSRLS